VKRPNILRGKRDFSRLYSKGKSSGSRDLTVVYLKNGQDSNRYAFIASKKVGNSVHRNRARRLMKESLRGIKDRVRMGYDILLIARPPICGRKCDQVAASLEKALSKKGLVK
jgi:ribonuclease P protein component